VVIPTAPVVVTTGVFTVVAVVIAIAVAAAAAEGDALAR
jgi:hypothetical protein